MSGRELNVYKCEVCGNIVEVINDRKGKLYCCNQPMILLEEKTEEQGYEKHIPVVEDKGDKVSVKVGSIEHPMEKEHYIQWIEVITQDSVYRKMLHPHEKPEAIFPVNMKDIIKVRAYCNIHGLWKK